MNEFEAVYVNRRFIERLQQTINNIEAAETQGEYNMNVGKLIGLVDWIAHIKFQEDFNATQLS